jgi:hypothetical protein
VTIIDRYRVLMYSGPASFMDNPDNRWVQVLDTWQRTIEAVAPARHRALLTELADRLNSLDRLRHVGETLQPVREEPQVVLTEDAASGDMHSGAGAWPFGAGHGRYRWTYAACGTVVTYCTNAMGLRLQGRVLQPHPVMAPARRLVQLVDEAGKVFASTPGIPKIAAEQGETSEALAVVQDDVDRVVLMEGSRGLERLRVLGTVTGRFGPKDPPMGAQ